MIYTEHEIEKIIGEPIAWGKNRKYEIITVPPGINIYHGRELTMLRSESYDFIMASLDSVNVLDLIKIRKKIAWDLDCKEINLLNQNNIINNCLNFTLIVQLRNDDDCKLDRVAKDAQRHISVYKESENIWKISGWELVTTL